MNAGIFALRWRAVLQNVYNLPIDYSLKRVNQIIMGDFRD